MAGPELVVVQEEEPLRVDGAAGHELLALRVPVEGDDGFGELEALTVDVEEGAGGAEVGNGEALFGANEAEAEGVTEGREEPSMVGAIDAHGAAAGEEGEGALVGEGHGARDAPEGSTERGALELDPIRGDEGPVAAAAQGSVDPLDAANQATLVGEAQAFVVLEDEDFLVADGEGVDLRRYMTPAVLEDIPGGRVEGRLEGEAEAIDGGEAPLGALGGGLPDDAGQGSWEPLRELDLGVNVAGHEEGGAPFEGAPAAEDLVEQDAESVDVDALVVLLLELFRGHVGRGAHGVAPAGGA